ncbi:MAG: S9 family peptidase [Pseudomonadota bacterium]
MKTLVRGLMIALMWGESAATVANDETVSASPSDLALESFAQLPRMRNAELSPDGRFVAYFYPLEGRDHIVMQPLADGDQRRIVPPVGELDFRWLKWANNERLVFAGAYSGERFNQETVETRLGSIKSDGSDLVWIVKPAQPDAESDSTSDKPHDIPPQIQDNVISWLADEPDHILVSLDENFDLKDEVRRINIDNGDYTIVRQGLDGVQDWIADSSDAVRLGYGYDEDGFVATYWGAQEQWIDLTATSWWGDGWQPIAFTDNPAMVYVIGPDADGFDVIKTLNVETGEFTEDIFSIDGYDVSGVVLDTVSGRPVGVRYVDHRPRVKYFDAVVDKLQRTVDNAFGGMHVSLISFSADRQKVLVKVSSDTDPGVLYFWDRSNKSMDVVSELMPGLAPELLSPVKPVSYKARDGYVVPAYLTTPLNQAARDLPTIVIPHGGPASRVSQSFDYLSQYLVSRGYAVFEPNFRGSAGYGAAHRQAGKGQWGGRMQDDVTDGVKWLIETGVAQAEKICIVGWSYGGYAAAMGLAQTPELYRCAVSINGVLDLPRLVADDNKSTGGRPWVHDIGLEGDKLEVISPYHLAEQIEAPLLLIQSKDDTIVNIDHATSMEKKLRKLDKAVELVTVDLGGHSMNNTAARRTVLERIEAFLQTHIKGE